MTDGKHIKKNESPQHTSRKRKLDDDQDTQDTDKDKSTTDSSQSETIASVKRQKTVKDPKQDKTADDKDVELCIICQEGYKTDCEMLFLQCGHHFHSKCIEQWLEDHKSCPICRTVQTARTFQKADIFPIADRSPTVVTRPTVEILPRAATRSDVSTSTTEPTQRVLLVDRGQRQEMCPWQTLYWGPPMYGSQQFYQYAPMSQCPAFYVWPQFSPWQQFYYWY